MNYAINQESGEHIGVILKADNITDFKSRLKVAVEEHFDIKIVLPESDLKELPDIKYGKSETLELAEVSTGGIVLINLQETWDY